MPCSSAAERPRRAKRRPSALEDYTVELSCVPMPQPWYNKMRMQCAGRQLCSTMLSRMRLARSVLRAGCCVLRLTLSWMWWTVHAEKAGGSAAASG